MSGYRNNHYVPQWHQAGFIEPGRNKLAYLDLTPARHDLPNGGVVYERSRFKSSPSQCFVQRDLYSTVFGAEVNDEIERRLFGEVDSQGAPAIRAFMTSDPAAWHRHFQDLFTYIDIQKLRTPKGLDWLRTRYPALSQNELMWEMQALQTISCSIWTEGVREIVSAEDSPVKFVLSDHPVTVFNPGLPPDTPQCAYPLDPDIALKGSQTIFPLGRDHCLILTNLEYAKDLSADPLERRTAARNYRASMARTDAFIRTRKLSEEGVRRVNMAIKSRARRYLAAGDEAWLFPEQAAPPSWREIAETLRPPRNELHRFGGEVLARYDDGSVYFQDAYGRREPEHRQMFAIEPATPRPSEACGCGSGRRLRDCCGPIPIRLRPSWSEMSIRERNLGLQNAVMKIFDLNPEKTWTEVRREMSDEKIRRIFEVFASLWPLETELLQLLPKPDGRPRAVYTGLLHPQAIMQTAAAAGLYFGEVIIQHPFTHPRTISPEHNPLENPQAYRGEILKTLLGFLELMPLVEAGLVILTPDPGAFDYHLRDQAYRLAKDRCEGLDLKPQKNERIVQLMEEDAHRAVMNMPPEVMVSEFRRTAPGSDDLTDAEILAGLEQLKLRDPLASLQAEPLAEGEAGGQYVMASLAPNFEMTMYLAQATGSCIITDAKPRFTELVDAIRRRSGTLHGGLPEVARRLALAPFVVPQDIHAIVRLVLAGGLAPYPQLFGETAKYLEGLARRGRKPNYERQLAATFDRARAIQSKASKAGGTIGSARVHALLPEHGLHDNTINRLLLMASSEHHWRSVPMAFYLEPLES
jgi:hypothetical protein